MTPALAWVSFPVMKSLLLVLAVGLVGCGEKGKEKTTPKAQAKAKATPKVEPKREAKEPEVVSWASDPNDPNNVKIEKAIRKQLKEPEGELTKADLEKVTWLDLYNNQLTDVNGLEKLTQLRHLDLNNNQLTDVKALEKLTKLRVLLLRDNPSLTKAQIAELQKALPKCDIYSNPTK